jgi:hypothetical protein
METEGMIHYATPERGTFSFTNPEGRGIAAIPRPEGVVKLMRLNEGVA